MPTTRLSRHLLLRFSFGRWLLPALAVAIIIISTGSFAYHLRQQSLLETQTRFSLDATLATLEIRNRLRSHAHFLQGLRAFVSSIPQLGPTDWARFSNYQTPQTNLPGIQSYGYLPAVSTAQLIQFEAKISALHKSPFRVFPSASAIAGTHFPVLYASPAESGNLSATGYDLASDPICREAMEMARDTDMVTMTQRLQLFPDQQTAARPGVIMFLPIYANNLPSSTVTERRQALRGYVFAAYRMSDFMQTLNYGSNPGIGMQVFDDGGYDSQKGGPQLTLLHDTHPEKTTNTTNTEERELEFAQRTWLLRFENLMPLPALRFEDPATLVIFSGLILAGLAGALIWFLTTQGQRALVLAQGMNQRLEQSEQRFNLAAEGANDGLWYRDFSMDTLHFSERAMQLLGYPIQPTHTSEAFFLALMHPDDKPMRRQALDAHLQRRVPFDLEVRLKRGDGNWGWFHLKGQATWDKDGVPVLMAGSLSDINNRKLGEIELLQHRDRLQELVLERTTRLEDALKDAREAARTKSEFLANMSHELRTPLHAMLGFASIGKGKTEKNEKIHHYFERIQQSAERLLSLVNDLLDLAKLEAHKMGVHPVLQETQPVLQQVVGELDSLLQHKQLHVDYDIRCHDTRALIDAPRIAQVLNNLLSNAIRFSPAGGTITFSFAEAEIPRGRRASDEGKLNALSLTVDDQGPGIPPGEQELIFDKFAQSTRTRTGAGGTGLGLAICLEIVEAHRGRICAENRPQGGARLILTLPREIDASPQEEAPS